MIKANEGAPPRVSELAEFATSYIAGGKSTDTVNEWSLEARTVKLSKPECLSCHTKSKLNDPIGVLVYSVKAKQ